MYDGDLTRTIHDDTPINTTLFNNSVMNNTTSAAWLLGFSFTFFVHINRKPKNKLEG